MVVNNFVAAQGNGKYVKEFVRGIKTKKGGSSPEDDAEDLLSAFKAGFKGLD